MNDTKFKALQASVHTGKATVAEKFLYEREKALREEPPNVLLRPKSISNLLGASADRKEG